MIRTLRAEGKIGEGISCKVETGRSIIDAGLHPATGGTGLLSLLRRYATRSIGGMRRCYFKAVTTAIGVEIKSGTIKAEGDLDFKGTLGVSKRSPVGFKNIRLLFNLDTDATEEQMANVKKLTERYCVVYQTLTNGIAVETQYHLS